MTKDTKKAIDALASKTATVLDTYVVGTSNGEACLWEKGGKLIGTTNDGKVYLFTEFAYSQGIGGRKYNDTWIEPDTESLQKAPCPKCGRTDMLHTVDSEDFYTDDANKVARRICSKCVRG